MGAIEFSIDLAHNQFSSYNKFKLKKLNNVKVKVNTHTGRNLSSIEEIDLSIENLKQVKKQILSLKKRYKKIEFSV